MSASSNSTRVVKVNCRKTRPYCIWHKGYYCLNVLLQLLLFLITMKTKPDNNSWLKGDKSCSYGGTINYWQIIWHLKSQQDIMLMYSLLHLFPPIWYCCLCFLLHTGIWVHSTAALPHGFQLWRTLVQLKNMLGKNWI